MSSSRTALRLAAASIAVIAVASLARRASAQSEQPPKPGGTLEIGTVYVTLSALSFDPADWNWKHNHDTGAVYEQLFVADLSKSKRLGGKHPFYADAWLPSDAIKGELAETWNWKQNPLRARDQPAQGRDVSGKAGRDGGARTGRRRRRVRLQPPRQEPEEDLRLFRSSRQGRGHRQAHRGVHLQELQRRMGLSLRLGLLLRHHPKEVADAGAGNWKNVNGTGPFMLGDFVQGNSNTYVKNPNYWGTEKINGVEIQAAAASTRWSIAPSRMRRPS